MTNAGFNSIIVSFVGAVILVFGICAVAWVGYCITSIARAADALERIADALEKDDEEEGEVSK